MKIPDEVRKTVAFIGYQNKTNGETVSVGSMFFLGHDPAEGTTPSPRVYAVTARHIISGLRAKG
jgi:hypothetical protein